MRRGALAACALTGLALVAGAVLGDGQAELDAPGGLREAPEIRTELLVDEVRAEGEVRSSDTVTIGCPSIPRTWRFNVTRLTPEGTEIRAGMPLIHFDAKSLQESLQVKRSELETARKELERTRIEEQEKLEQLELEHAEIEARRGRLARKLEVPVELLERIELDKLRLDAELADDELRLIGERIETQRLNRTAKIRAGESRVRRLERDVDDLGRHIARMVVSAPRDGFVVHVPDWNGNKVKVGESVWLGRPIMQVADLSRMEVAAEIAEPDAGFVRVGQTVEIRLDAAPERLFKGRIEELGRLFRTKSSDTPSIVFDAVVSIDEPDPELMRPGMAAELLIRTGPGA